MKINPKSITLKNGKIAVLRSPTADDAEELLKHIRITHTESYQNMNRSLNHWNRVSISDEAQILSDDVLPGGDYGVRKGWH